MVILAGCDGPQSTLVPAGVGAERIATLWWWMCAGAVVIWGAVMGVAIYATRVRPGRHDPRAMRFLIVGGGVVTPVSVLGVLLGYGLFLIPELSAPAPADGLRIAVSGEQWWWRVRYAPPGGEAVELANEVRLPVGERVEISLESPDVIHSFWIPSLGGKVDMIPGRINRLVLEPTRTGVFRGVCAEYCGTSHALMNFAVVVMEPDAFSDWLARQAAPAEAPADAMARHGRDLFLAYGCGGCHAVRGTPADGRIAPDLTHIGSRLTVGAGILPNDAEALTRWIAATDDIKPGVHMPAFPMLPAEDLRAIAHYLEGLR